MQMQKSLRDIIEWDIRNWSNALRFWDHHLFQDLSGKTALEIGARSGGLSLWLAMKGATVTCSDLANPEKDARIIHEKYGIASRITYQALDATDLPYENAFDIICFKSVLGGVGRNNHPELQARAIQQMHKALKPGGQLLFAENLIASPLHHYFRKKFVRWGSEWRYITIDEIKKYCSGFSSFSYGTAGFLGGFGRTESQRNALAFLDKYLLDKLVPDSWKYIVYGVATK